MEDKITLSIVIPLYNKENYISRTLNSIIIQNQQFLTEVIVIDDGSTDNSPFVIKNYKSLGKKLKLVTQANRGASAARNSGINLAGGKYVIFLDADDELLEGALDAYVEMIKVFPECTVFGINFYIERNNIRLAKRQKHLTQKSTIQKINYLKGTALGDGYLTSSSACIRKDSFKEAGIFIEGMIQREDPHMWIRLTLHGQMAFCKTPLVIYHQDDANRVCSLHRAVDDFPDSILLMNLIKSDKLKGADVTFAKMIIASNYLAQAFQNLREYNWSHARNSLNKAGFRFVHNKVNLFIAYFLIYSGTWILFDKILRTRFKILKLFQLDA